MKVLKRHMGLTIIGGLTLILLIVIFAIFARLLFSGNNSVYGDRLKGIVKIDSSVTKKVKNEVGDMSEVEDISIRTQGKIIYMTIVFTESTSKDKAKEIASKILTYYSDKVVGYYDFEFLLTQNAGKTEDDSKFFTISGTKHPDREKISWTRN